jgi:hypothetical protein
LEPLRPPKKNWSDAIANRAPNPLFLTELNICDQCNEKT